MKNSKTSISKFYRSVMMPPQLSNDPHAHQPPFLTLWMCVCWPIGLNTSSSSQHVYITPWLQGVENRPVWWKSSETPCCLQFFSPCCCSFLRPNIPLSILISDTSNIALLLRKGVHFHNTWNFSRFMKLVVLVVLMWWSDADGLSNWYTVFIYVAFVFQSCNF